MVLRDILAAILIAILAFMAISLVAYGVRSLGLVLFVAVAVGVWIYLKKHREP